MENEFFCINGRKVLGVRDHRVDDLDSLLYSLADTYALLREDEVLSSCLAQMHSRLDEICPCFCFDEDIGQIVTVYLAEGVPDGAGEVSV